MRALTLLACAASAAHASVRGQTRSHTHTDTRAHTGSATQGAIHTTGPSTIATSGGVARAARVPTGNLPREPGTHVPQVAPARPEQVKQRPSLIDYNPKAQPGAIVTSPDGMARFTVLTDRLIRMEYARQMGVFEDNATIAMLNRNLPVPQFVSNINARLLTIKTNAVTLTYAIGLPFSAQSLNVTSNNASSMFPGWNYGQPSPGNLLGTIRGLDVQNNTPLNCTQNAAILDNGEYNHCEWGLVSRDGWAVYDDSKNFVLDSNDWWIPQGGPPQPRTCNNGAAGTDVLMSSRSSVYPDGTTATSPSDCCNKCLGASDCVAWVYATDGSNDCWPLAGWDGTTSNSFRTFGQVANQTLPTAQNGDAVDLYGFFHGHDYFGALADFVQVSGKTIMVPKYASGVWWSRWFDLNNYDVMKVVDDYDSRQIPLDVFVIDMDWHTKDAWGGWTFDSNLFPFPADTMNYLKAMGLPVTLNTHDASGVLPTDAQYQALVNYLGLPATGNPVGLDLLNATMAYAVSVRACRTRKCVYGTLAATLRVANAVQDIVWGDLVYNKNVSFAWIDWQQGGNAGGMTGFKQNPTIWLNHIRCTDRHRNGDNTRAMVLARWGGLGGHRYQVGFSGDVAELTWGNAAYQPYFSATAANVGHFAWSHDIEGPALQSQGGLELYVRWIQIGAFSGTMRSHDRGMSAGSCANDEPFSCSIVEPWNTPNVDFPDVYMEANRLALQARAALLPYVYNGHRSAFDTGVGHIRPMYYHYPELNAAYGMDANGNNVQYMFGPSILFSPVVQAGDTTQTGMGPGLATKTTWLPPGTWVDVNSGVITTVAPGDSQHMITKAYHISEIPLWYAAGAVIPYVPIKSLPTTVGNAAQQYTFLGFKIVPGAATGSVSVYEDDGSTTAYLTSNAYAWTTATYTVSGDTTTVSITTAGAYPELPATRSYQIRLLNAGPLSSVTVNGQAVSYNRYGRVASNRRVPSASQHYWDFSIEPMGMGAVIDIVNVPTSTPLNVVITAATSLSASDMSGVYGAVSHAILAKLNLDIERSTPGSNTVEPAHTSVLASVGGALEYLAGTNPSAFASTVASVPQLLANATSEINGMTSQRKSFSLGLLQSAMQ